MAAFFPAPATAWNAAGHRLIAAIAWRQLDLPARRRVDDALAQHPDAGRWRGKDTEPASEISDATSSLLLFASTWPDDIKRDARFHDPGEYPTPPRPGFPDMLRHRDWHYADRPDDENCTASGELERQLAVFGEMLRDNRRDDGQSPESAPTPALRAYALGWAIHLLGDAHQPLHAGIHCDRGGNALLFSTPFHPRFEQLTLHAFWDDLPGPPWLSGVALEETAQRWLREIPPPAPGAGPREWLEESRELARGTVYAGLYETAPEKNDPSDPPRESAPLPVLSAAYRERAATAARRRIVHAGYRLAEWLRAATWKDGDSRSLKEADANKPKQRTATRLLFFSKSSENYFRFCSETEP